MDKKEEMLKEMKEAQAKQQEIAKRTGRGIRGAESTLATPVHENHEDKASVKTDAERIKELEAKLKKQKEEKAKMEQEINNSLPKYESPKVKEQRILENKDADHFVKKYTVTTSDNQKREFVIKMHAPSIAEQISIQQEYTDITQGRGSGFVPDAQELFLSIAYYRVVGDNVPDWFIDVENTYRTDILIMVWIDYQNWLNGYLDTKLK